MRTDTYLNDHVTLKAFRSDSQAVHFGVIAGRLNSKEPRVPGGDGVYFAIDSGGTTFSFRATELGEMESLIELLVDAAAMLEQQLQLDADAAAAATSAATPAVSP